MGQETQEQGSLNILMVLGVIVVIAALIGGGYAFFEMQNANQAEATAIANQEIAEENAALATAAQGEALNEAATAIADRQNAEAEATEALIAQGNAEDSQATAVAQATESAGIASTANAAQSDAEEGEATAFAQSTSAAEAESTALANATEAVSAQQAAEAEATDAVMIAETAVAQATDAVMVAETAVAEADEALIAQGNAEDSQATAVAQATESAGIASTAVADAETAQSEAEDAIAAQATSDAALDAQADVVSDLEATIEAQDELLAAADDEDKGDDEGDDSDDETTVFVPIVDISLDDLEDEDFDVTPYSLANLEIPDFTLFSEEDGFIEVNVLGVTIADFMLDVTVENPDVQGFWDYGVLFRMDGDGEYRVSINSFGGWDLVWRDGGDFNTIDEGIMTDFVFTAGEENRVRLITAGDEGLLVINDEVIELDLSDKSVAGDIFISIEIGGSFSEEDVPVDMSEAVLWALGVPGDNLLGDEADGEFDSSSQVDEWWYFGDADTVVDIEASSDDDNVDTRILIYDSFGAPVQVSSIEDDDAFIESFVLPSTGFYRLLINSPTGDTGEYTIEVSESDFEVVDVTGVDGDDAEDQMKEWQDGDILYEEDDFDIDHDTENGFIETIRLDQGIANFLIEATITNPYDYEDEGQNWDYGFLFREGESLEYYLIFEPGGRWELWLRFGDSDLGVFESKRVDAGFVEDWEDDEGDENDFQLGAYNNVGILVVNGELVAVLDLSDNVLEGDLEIVTGFDANAEVDGESTLFEDIT
ncbi:MAG: hypothetical protein AAFR81_29230, partial [Chloroflexota bacterium]